MGALKVVYIRAENPHHWGKYHCTSCLKLYKCWFNCFTVKVETSRNYSDPSHNGECSLIKDCLNLSVRPTEHPLEHVYDACLHAWGWRKGRDWMFSSASAGVRRPQINRKVERKTIWRWCTGRKMERFAGENKTRVSLETFQLTRKINLSVCASASLLLSVVRKKILTFDFNFVFEDARRTDHSF